MLEKYRNKIDEIDDEFTKLFNERFKIIEEIIKYKKENNLPILDSNREKEILNNNLNKIDLKYQKYFKEVYLKLLEESKKFQKEV